MKTLQADKPAPKTKQTGEVRMGSEVSSKKAAGGNAASAASAAKSAEKKEKAELQEDRASSLV